MNFRYDEFGDPADPELKKLFDQLCDLAMQWRGNKGNSDVRENIKQKYHEVAGKLFEQGWNGNIDIECMLPTDQMPTEFWKETGGKPPSFKGFFRNNESDPDR